MPLVTPQPTPQPEPRVGSPSPSPMAEGMREHTRILRVMLAAEDSLAYWRAPFTPGTLAERLQAAFEGHWFGSKSEARVKTLLGDMALRFDAFPAALTALRLWQPPREVTQWICHFHIQLADPIYRRFSGEYLPARRGQGYANVDRESVARWIQETWPGRWAPVTAMKFGGNMLATAFEAGLVKERRDPRHLVWPHPPVQAVEYLLYLLREVSIAAPILHSPYIRAIAPDAEDSTELLRPLQAVGINGFGDARSFRWSYPDLLSWAQAQGSEGKAIQ